MSVVVSLWRISAEVGAEVGIGVIRCEVRSLHWADSCVSVVEPTCEHQHVGCTGARYLVKMLFDVVFQSSYSYSLYY